MSALPAGCMNQSEVSALPAGCMNQSEVSALSAGCMNQSEVSALSAGSLADLGGGTRCVPPHLPGILVFETYFFQFHALFT